VNLLPQITFDDLRKATVIRDLTGRQRKILSFLSDGNTQGTIAKILKVSPAYISTQVKIFLGLGIIQRKDQKKTPDGKREYCHFYELSPDAKGQISGENVLPITSFHVHHIGVKYRIIRQSGPLSEDRRIAGQPPELWYPHPKDKRYKFWYSGKKGYPAVTLYVHPKTIIAWVDKHQMIQAQSLIDAERLGDEAIARAIDRFIDQQRLFRVTVEIDSGKIMGKRHYGALIAEGHPDIRTAKAEGLNAPGWFVDNSPDDQIPGMAEAETTDLSRATGLEKVINLAPKIVELAEMPSLIKDTHAQVAAMMQGGRPLELQYSRALDLIERLLERLERQDARIAELEKKVNG